MSMTLLATILLVLVVIAAWRRSSGWLFAGGAVLLGVAIASTGGPLNAAATGLLDGGRSLLTTISATLF